MKIFQILIVLFILTVSASVYAMGIFINPFPIQPKFETKIDSPKISHGLSQPLTAPTAVKPSANKARMLALVEQQRINRRLFAST